jgi:hypothetical protein
VDGDEAHQGCHHLGLEAHPRVPEPVAACILRVPRAKAANFYQASRAATYLALSPSPPLLDGARIVLDAACPDGAGDGSGERAFAHLMAMTAAWPPGHAI